MKESMEKLRNNIKAQLENQEATSKRWVAFPDVKIPAGSDYSDLRKISKELSKAKTYEVDNIVYFRANK